MALGENYEPSKVSLAILDEVQKGETLGAVVNATRSIVDKQGFNPRISVVAAQDTRRSVASQPKTSDYRMLATNSVDNISVTVVPMPLITVDRRNLLDTVYLEGNDPDSPDISNRLRLERNVAAESLFRTLGSLARTQELRHDSLFQWGLVESQGLRSMEASNRIEDWFTRLVKLLDNLQLNK